MYETFDTPFYMRHGSIQVNYSSYTAEWQITGKTYLSKNDVAAYTTYGTDRANAYRLLEDALNLRDIRIYDTIEDVDGREKRVLNAKETTLAAQSSRPSGMPSRTGFGRTRPAARPWCGSTTRR